MLDAASLEAITQEARACFLYEDAPAYQSELEQGLQKLLGGEDPQIAIASLMKTAHSLKGGAGIAQLPNLAHLAHKLEDLLAALHQQQVPQPETAYTLLQQAIEQISVLIAAATRQGDAVASDASLPVCEELERFLATLPTTPDSNPPNEPSGITPHPALVKTALTVDLEECLQRVEPLIRSGQATETLPTVLTQFCQECQLLGEVLSLPWLREAVMPVQNAIADQSPQLAEIAQHVIAHIRQQRDQTLGTTPTSDNPEQPTPPAAANPAPDLNLRMPLTRLDRIENALTELLIGYERLHTIGEQFQQTSLALKQQAQHLTPISEQVQTFYDQLATPTTPQAETSSEFDPLQFDRYSDLHGTLQSLQELMVRSQENRADIEELSRDFFDSLDQLRTSIDSLRQDLTQARLVPFRTFAEKFAAPLANLNQRYGKSVTLKIEGEDTPVDQAILEQLQTPFNHLFRNAFDHGIEPISERRASGKSPDAQIVLAAQLQGDRVLLTIADDGRGIDLEKVRQRAVERGICPPQAQLTRSQILDLIFTPGFSTTTEVTALSGRGVGLEVVRWQVERLRGSVRVATTPGQGTQFILSIPLTLQILPLLLCRAGGHSLALPSLKVLEVVSLGRTEDGKLLWQDRWIPVYPLAQLLPYAQPIPPRARSPFGLILDTGAEPLAVAVDSIQGERELVLKPFDRLVPVPPYVAGCTVLGNAEVVPVLEPSHLPMLVTTSGESVERDRASEPTGSQTPTILVVDDSVTARRTLERLLREAGYQVMACRDGKEAATVLTQPHESIDLVISDIEMPRLDGYSLLQIIRSDRRWCNLPVVMLTSRNHDRHRQKALDLGASGYLSKPFRSEELLSAIAAWVDRK